MLTEVVFKKWDDFNTVACDDRIFLGEGLIETLKVVNGRPCYPDLHWQRLQESAQLLGIKFRQSLDEWRNNLLKSIQLIQLTEGGIKVILSAGRAKRGLISQGKGAQLLFQAFHYKSPSRAVKLITAPWRRDKLNPIYQFKSVSYLEAIMAARQGRALGANDTLFFNLDDYATETTVANFFVVQKETLVTPSLDCGILNGIIRSKILVLSKKFNIPCIEGKIGKRMIFDADALFICNALQGIREVSAWDGLEFNTGNSLIKTLRKLLSSDLIHSL